MKRKTGRGRYGDSAPIVLYGVPFQEIIETAKARRVDLIVMGTHGRTGLMYVLLGSAAEQVIRLALCSVFVVRG
jgi:nucleotide-binding universal stress UspA family protein